MKESPKPYDLAGEDTNDKPQEAETPPGWDLKSINEQTHADQPVEDKGVEQPKAVEAVGEKSRHDARMELAEQRIGKIKGFFRGIKDGFVSRVNAVGDRIKKIPGQAAELGKRGIKEIITAPEAVMNGIRTVRRVTNETYKGAKETVVGAKDAVVNAGKAVVEKGKEKVQDAKDAVSGAYNNAIDFGVISVARGAARISESINNFGNMRLSKRIEKWEKQAKEGRLDPEKKQLLNRINACVQSKNLAYSLN